MKGLESLQARIDDLAIEWSVGSNGESRVSLRRGKEEIPLDKSSEYFTQPRIVASSDKVPLSDGYFEVPLPAKLLADKPREISLQWIDFYR